MAADLARSMRTQTPSSDLLETSGCLRRSPVGHVQPEVPDPGADAVTWHSDSRDAEPPYTMVCEECGAWVSSELFGPDGAGEGDDGGFYCTSCRFGDEQGDEA